jgi:hypothetical protein
MDAATIGSQGFAALSIFKFDDGQAAGAESIDLRKFELIRIHFWAPRIGEGRPGDQPELFGIHSHAFHARSWVLAGTIEDSPYGVSTDSQAREFGLFEIQYDKSLANTDTHSSVAVNTGNSVSLLALPKRLSKQGESYEVQAGDFHSSRAVGESRVAVTVFYFNGNRGLSLPSHVAGPPEVEESRIDRDRRAISLSQIARQASAIRFEP